MAKNTAAKKTDPVDNKEPDAAEAKVELEVVEVVNAEPVTMSRLSLEVEVNTRHRVTVKKDVTPEQCMDEGFWTHISNRLSPNDEIVVMPDNSRWKLVLHVVNCGPQFAHVAKLEFYELAAADSFAKLPSMYKVDFGGPIHKWRFLRDGKMMRDGFATESLAQRAASQHEMAVNRTTPR